MNPFSELRAMKTLLVDDDDFIRDSLQTVFKNQRCFLQTAVNAEEGLKALERQRFNIVLSDAKLPGTDGLNFLKKVGLAQPDALRVLITSYGDKICLSTGAAGWVHGFIEKPFSVETLAESLALLTRRQLITRPEENHNVERMHHGASVK